MVGCIELGLLEAPPGCSAWIAEFVTSHCDKEAMCIAHGVAQNEDFDSSLINYVLNAESLITVLCELFHSTKTVQTVTYVSI